MPRWPMSSMREAGGGLRRAARLLAPIAASAALPAAAADMAAAVTTRDQPGLVLRHVVGSDIATRGRWLAANDPPDAAARAFGASAATGPAPRPFAGVLDHLDGPRGAARFRLGMTQRFAGERIELGGRLHVVRRAAAEAPRLAAVEPLHAFGEIALAWRPRGDLAIGAEYRLRPDPRGQAGPVGTRARDGAWKDIFVSWSPGPHLSLTAAYVDLGTAAGGVRQSGRFFSAELRY